MGIAKIARRVLEAKRAGRKLNSTDLHNELSDFIERLFAPLRNRTESERELSLRSICVKLGMDAKDANALPREAIDRFLDREFGI